MKTVYIESNGCAVLRNETQKYAKYFRENGFTEINSPKFADIILFTGCGVVDWTEDKAIEALERITKLKKPSAFVLFGGCLPKINPDRIKLIDPNITLFSFDSDSILEEIIEPKIKLKDIHFRMDSVREHSYGDPEKVVFSKEELEQEKISNFLDKTFNTEKFIEIYNYLTKSRHLWKEKGLYEVKVSTGCSANCSYCATKLAIGETKSIPVEIVLEEVKKGIEKGYKKIMLMGDEVGFYGVDLGTDLIYLIEEVFKLEGDFRLGLRYIHPNVLIKNYGKLKKYFESGKIYYFCAAFQSGSKKILKLMNRNPDLNKFIKIMQDLDQTSSEVIKHTQIIVGFPGETSEDFQDTLDTLERCNFDYITATAFSPRKGTKAYDFKGRLSKKQLDERYSLALDFVANNRNKQYWKRTKRELCKNLD